MTSNNNPAMSHGRAEDYRTCNVCGGDCEPETSAVDGIGVRIIFSCPDHGVHSILDPFDELA